MWETAWAEAALARRFVERLRQVPAHLLAPAVPPIFDAEPYLSAWINVETALGNAPAADRERVAGLLNEIDRAVTDLALAPVVMEAARRAGRALLARRWLTAPESFTFVYEPFESVIPLASLQA